MAIKLDWLKEKTGTNLQDAYVRVSDAAVFLPQSTGSRLVFEIYSSEKAAREGREPEARLVVSASPEEIDRLLRPALLAAAYGLFKERFPAAADA